MEDFKKDDNIMQYKFHDLIVNKKYISLSLYEFFDVMGFNSSVFFDAPFWSALNSLENDEWFEVSNDIIESIGYKGTQGSLDHMRRNLFKLIKKQFIVNIDYILTVPPRTVSSGSHNKMTLKMKRDSFKMLLMLVNTQHCDQIYRYLINVENQVKQYETYQHECKLYLLDREKAQLKAQMVLNNFQLNKLRSDRVQKYVCIATNEENAKNNLYKIRLTDNLTSCKSVIYDDEDDETDNEDDEDDDDMFFVHTVLTYDAEIVEQVLHTHFKDYKYKERVNNSANKWYLLPLDTIKKHMDHWAQVFNDGNIHLETVMNELNNLI